MKKVALVLGGIIALWYALILCLPEVADHHGRLAFPISIQHTMQQLSLSQPSYNGAKAQLDKLGWTLSHRGITYQYSLSKHDTATWELVARPNKTSVYCYPWWKRILFADFCRYKINAFRIRAGEEHPETID